MAQAQDLHQQIEAFADQAPEIADAIKRALDKWTTGPKPAHLQRHFQQMRREVVPILEDYKVAAKSLQHAAQAAALEHNATMLENVLLKQQVDELQRDLDEWRREYEPDDVPDRPAMFSNIRHAFRVLFHAR